MTAKNAMAQGLVFTGCWTNAYWEKDMCTKRAAEIRKKYKCKAYVCTDDGGWGVYADEKYDDMQTLERAELFLARIPGELHRAQEKFDTEVAEIHKREISYANTIATIKNKYNLNGGRN